MNNKLSIGALIVIAIIAISAHFTPAGVIRETVRELGAVVSPDINDHVSFNQNFTKGGTQVATTSTASTYTLTRSELRKDVSYISWNVGVNTTLTTMASTSAPLSELKTGESFTVLFHNASTTAGATATFAAGTGVDLQENEGGVVVVNGLEFARLTFVKKANTDVALIVETTQTGD